MNYSKHARLWLGHHLQRVTAMRERRQHELHTIKIQSRVGKISIEIHAADPLRFGRNANSICTENRSRCVRAMTAFIIG